MGGTNGVERVKPEERNCFWQQPEGSWEKPKLYRVGAKCGWIGLILLIVTMLFPAVGAWAATQDSRQESGPDGGRSFQEQGNPIEKGSGRAAAIAVLDKLYQQRKCDAVVALGEKILAENPAHPECNLLVGRALADLMRYREAIPHLKKATVAVKGRLWIKGRALECLGRCYFALGNPEASKARLNECLALQASKNSVVDASYNLKLFGFTPLFENWRTVESEHFVFHLQQPSKITDVQGYIAKCENDFGEINRLFSSQLPKKIDMFIYNSNEDLQKIVAGPDLAGQAFSQYCVTHQCRTAVKHEMVHIITYYYGKPQRKSNIVNEGTAEYYSNLSRCGLDYINLAAQKEKVTAISVRELWNNWNAYPGSLTYPLAGAFVDFLIQNGGFTKFCQLLKDPTYETGKKVYGAFLEQLMAQFDSRVNQYLASNQELLKEVRVLNAYWKSAIPLQDMAFSKLKTHSFFVAVDYPVEQVDREIVRAFLGEAGFELELVAEGRSRIGARVYESTGYNWDDQFYSGFWLNISDPEFQRMEPGAPYRLIAKKNGPGRQWVIGDRVRLIKPE